jgi:hypothetical protein
MRLPFAEVWTNCRIPGLREVKGTYGDFPLAQTPALDVPDDLSWLTETDRRLIALMGWREPSAPDFEESEPLEDSAPSYYAAELEMVLTQAETAGLELPAAFVALFQSSLMQNRILDPTGCYFSFPERGISRDPFGLGGHILRFQNDQQCCVMWYLFMPPSGPACVLVSEGTSDVLFLEDLDPEDSDHIRLAIEKTTLCAHSFAEFLYRFWIEGALYFKLTHGAPLNPAEELYVSALKSLTPKG